MKVYVLDISILDDKALFDELYLSMPDRRKEKIDSLKPARSRQLSLGAGWLTDYALKRSGYPELAGCIAEEENGKPYINDSAAVFFNLSHSGTKVMCAVSDCPVGCDIQIMNKAAERQRQIAEHAFTRDEIMYVFGDMNAGGESSGSGICIDRNNCNERDPDPEGGPEEAATNRFYRIWTMKEAYTKYLGLGLRKEFRSFSVLEMTGHFLEYKTGSYRMAVYADSISAYTDPETVDIKERRVWDAQ